MNKSFLFLLSLAAPIMAGAQLNHGGEPLQWADSHFSLELPFITTPELDKQLIAAQDAISDPIKDAPWRFGIEVPCEATPENAGQWTFFPEENLAVWHLGIECPGATGISLEFEKFRIPKGGKMYLWDASRTVYRGALTHLNNKDHGGMTVGLISSDRIVIEYQIAMDAEDWGDLKLKSIIHAYRGLQSKLNELQAEQDRGPFGNSGACNINVNCPEGDAWQVEKRSVALIADGGWALCSGALVNNTNNDGTPYFLTANHCLGGESGWVFYFNHESSTCSGSTGPVDDSISGSDLKANNSGSDFALLLLDETPPDSWNVQYSGWDATDNEANVNSAVGIHHPSGDVKKICFEEDAPYHSFQGGAQVWFIDNWEDGVTEGGSSGSPLFDQNHRIIGQLYGGASACAGSVNNGLFDYYGRFGVSWDAGSTASTRLKDWLDPGNTGVSILDGWPEGFEALNYDAGVSSVEGLPSTLCGQSIYPEVVIYNYGTTTLTSATVHYKLNGGAEQTLDWTGSIAQYGNATVDLPVLTAIEGNNDLQVWITDPNGVADENPNNNNIEVTFVALTGDVAGFSMQLLTDDFPEETTWAITDENLNILYSGGPYNAAGDLMVIDGCLPEGCYTLTVFDSYGDGICCVWGNGNYELQDADGNVLAAGAEFGNADINTFCIEVVTGIGTSDGPQSIAAWPNPANASIGFYGVSGINLEVKLFDVSARLVQRSTSGSGSCVLDTNLLPSGLYYAHCLQGGVSVVLPVQITH